MKLDFIFKTVSISNEDWFSLQNKALEFWKNISNHDQNNISYKNFIPDEYYASSKAQTMFENTEIENWYEKLKLDNQAIYFRPIKTNSGKDKNHAWLTMKSYFLKDFHDKKILIKNDIEFNTEFLNQKYIEQLTDNFLENEVKVWVVSHSGITLNSLLKISETNLFTGKKSFGLIKSEDVLSKGIDVYDKKSGFEMIIDDYKLKIEKVWRLKRLKISDRTARLIGVNGVKTLEDAKKFINKLIANAEFEKSVLEYINNLFVWFISHYQIKVPLELEGNSVLNSEKTGFEKEVQKQRALIFNKFFRMNLGIKINYNELFDVSKKYQVNKNAIMSNDMYDTEFLENKLIFHKIIVEIMKIKNPNLSTKIEAFIKENNY